MIGFLLGRLLRGWANDDRVKVQSKPWPTWLVCIAMIAILGGLGCLIWFTFR